MLTVLALVPYPPGRAPGQRYRLEQWAPLLLSEGIRVVFSPFLPAWAMRVLYRNGHLTQKAAATLAGFGRRLVQVPRLSSYDACLVYREATLLGPPWLERWAASRRPLMFDFDDAIFLRDPTAANPWAARLRPADKTASLCRMAAHVTVGNEMLAAFARRHCPFVTVIPSTIDTVKYTVRRRYPNPRPVLGWTGSPTTVRYLKRLHAPLLRLREVVDFELLVVGVAVDLPGVDVRWIPWRADTEADDLRSIDIGVMPLTDDEWSRGKGGMKALQYMALGIPAVVSPVGANATIVVDGHNGLHATSDEEWFRQLLRLIRDPALGARLGQQARATVEHGYSCFVQAPRLARVIESVVHERRSSIRRSS